MTDKEKQAAHIKMLKTTMVVLGYDKVREQLPLTQHFQVKKPESVQLA